MIYYNISLFLPCAGSSRKSRKDIIMEIERKFLVMTPPENYESFPCHEIEQAYLCTEPVIRVRKEDDTCYLTYKSKGLLAREEYNLPLTNVRIGPRSNRAMMMDGISFLLQSRGYTSTRISFTETPFR